MFGALKRDCTTEDETEQCSKNDPEGFHAQHRAEHNTEVRAHHHAVAAVDADLRAVWFLTHSCFYRDDGFRRLTMIGNGKQDDCGTNQDCMKDSVFSPVHVSTRQKSLRTTIKDRPHNRQRRYQQPNKIEVQHDPLLPKDVPVLEWLRETFSRRVVCAEKKIENQPRTVYNTTHKLPIIRMSDEINPMPHQQQTSSPIPTVASFRT